MAESILGWVKGKLASVTGVPGGGDLPSARVVTHFKPLAKVDRSLPAEVARYVADGSNPSVILSLQKSSIQTQWAQRPRYWPARDEGKLFADLSAWRPDQMQRFGEALAALEPIRSAWGVFGTKRSPDWLRHAVTIWMGHDRKGQPIACLVDLAAQGGEPVLFALDILLCRDAASYGSNNSVDRFARVADWLLAESDAVIAVAKGLEADGRAELAAAIGRFGLHRPYLDLLLDLAVGSSKKARANARQSLTACDRADLASALAARFAKAAPKARIELIEAAMETLADAAPALLAQWRETETDAKVLLALDRSASAVASPIAAAGADARPDGPEGYRAVDGSWIEIALVPPLPAPAPVPPELLQILEPAMTEFNAVLAKGKAEASRQRWHWSRQYSTKGSGDLRKIAQLAEGHGPISTNGRHPAIDWLRCHQFKHPGESQFLHDPRLSLRHLARLAVAMTNGYAQGLNGEWGGPIGSAVTHRLTNDGDLRAFNALWLEAGGQDFLAEHLARSWHMPLPDFGAPLWPLLWERHDQIDQALGLVPQSTAQAKRPLPGLEMLEHFPKLPDRYRARLMLLAEDGSARLREKARALLRDAPGLGAAIAIQLQDGKQATRALAADWLAARNETGQADALRTALNKEKSDLARAAMITALDRMGEDVSAYFDQAAMVKEAQAGLSKTKAAGLDWFPFEMLPALQWADGGAVDPVLPKWWVTLAAKLKQPGGNALMNLWLDRLAPGQAHKLGWMVMTGWMDADTRRPTDEESNAHAAQHVDAVLRQNIAWAKRWPDSADYYPIDRDQVFARLKQAKASEYLGTAVDSKGVLALAARVSGADAAQRGRAFLKDHGARTSQAKAVLDMLAANGSSAALQTVLATANRFKQRSVQAHAAALVEEIAERNGWSAAQLADRTIPTGGFDTDGRQELELGEGRLYTLQLDAQDALVILNADGREVKALPGPRVDDEKPIVDAARKQLSDARKEVKQVLAAQTERLQEAMFLQRQWDRAEWESFIIGHPIVGRIAARLIWQGVDEDGAPGATFRPLGDGSYSDAGDNDVAPDGYARLRLAHSSLMTKEAIAAWRTHLADYAVEPPFDQLGRDLPVLAEEQRKQQVIADREGWMIETFKLRGLAAKLGYQRGPAVDGGWFVTYEKTYREAGLVAEIEFSGSPLPEENRSAALIALAFRKQRAGGGTGGQILLGDVPPVLLAESWRDLHDIADKGTGFDPDWQKKAY